MADPYLLDLIEHLDDLVAHLVDARLALDGDEAGAAHHSPRGTAPGLPARHTLPQLPPVPKWNGKVEAHAIAMDLTEESGRESRWVR